MNKWQKYEMMEVNNMLTEIVPEYNEIAGSREKISNVLFNKNTGYIRIRYQSYSYLVFIFKNAYHIAWFHRNDEGVFIQDGVLMFDNIDDVRENLRTFIWGGFSPRRGEWWRYNKNPRKYCGKKPNGYY